MVRRADESARRDPAPAHHRQPDLEDGQRHVLRPAARLQADAAHMGRPEDGQEPGRRLGPRVHQHARHEPPAHQRVQRVRGRVRGPVPRLPARPAQF